MKNHHYVVLLSLALLLGCSPRVKPISKRSAPAAHSAIILQINDVYEIDALDGGKIGGMARVATLEKQLRAENPNTLLVLAGDFLNPSLLGTMKYNGKRIKGAQMVELMNAVGVDLVSFGNHEFDLKENELIERLNESDFQWLGTNVRHKCGDHLFPFMRTIDGVALATVDSYRWLVSEGFDIVFIGATIDSNEPEYVQIDPWTARFRQEMEAAERAGADMIIGLTHLDETQDLQLARDIDGIDLILGGHDHDHMALEANGTPVFKADANAKSAYVHRISYHPTTGDIDIDSELIFLNEDIIPDPETQVLVDRWNIIRDENMLTVVDDPDAVVYSAVSPLDGRESSIRNGPTNLGQIVANAYVLDRPSIDAGFVNSGSIRIDDQLSGTLRSVDIFRVLPFGGYVVDITMTGELLIEILNYGLSKRGNGAFLQISDELKHLAARNSWYIEDELIDPKRAYTIATSDFMLTGYDIPFLTREHPGIIRIDEGAKDDTEDVRHDVRKIIIEYLSTL